MVETRILFSSNVFQSFPFAWLLKLRNILNLLWLIYHDKLKKKKNHLWKTKWTNFWLAQSESSFFANSNI